MATKPGTRSRTRGTRKKTATRAKAATKQAAAKARPVAAKTRIGKPPIRTAPRGDRFYEPEMTIRKFALGMPEAAEDFPWGHRAFRVGKGKIFLFLAWDHGVFSLTAKLPQSQSMALTLPFTELTGYGMGRSGWVTAKFQGRDEVPVGLLVQWIEESFRAIAPKKVAALMQPGPTA
jgi:predicted DNA-binding protein (MmcQ/YjbR family)